MLASDDISASGGGNEDLTSGSSIFHGGNLVSRNSGLEGIDGIDLSDENASTHGMKCLSTALADITESSDDSNLSGNHDIGSTLDTINKRLSASVKVVEFGFCDGVVDVDGRDEKSALLKHLVQVVHTGSGLLRHSVAIFEHLGVFVVNESGKITTVVEDEVELLAILEGGELLLQAPVVLLLGLSLPGEDRDSSSSSGGGGMVLGGEDVATRPGHFGTEGGEGLDEDGSLNGYPDVSNG
jgi:hypothetical protein